MLVVLGVPVCFHIREFEGGVENCIHPPHSAPSHHHQTVLRSHHPKERQTTYCGIGDTHPRRRAPCTTCEGCQGRPLWRVQATGIAHAWPSAPNVSAAPFEHGDTALATVASVSLEKTCCASVTS